MPIYQIDNGICIREDKLVGWAYARKFCLYLSVAALSCLLLWWMHDSKFIFSIVVICLIFKIAQAIFFSVEEAKVWKNGIVETKTWRGTKRIEIGRPMIPKIRIISRDRYGSVHYELRLIGPKGRAPIMDTFDSFQLYEVTRALDLGVPELPGERRN